MPVPYIMGQQNKNKKKVFKKRASEKVTHAFSRSKISSTSHNSACFPLVSLTEYTSSCSLHLLPQGQMIKKETCTSLLQTGFRYQAKLNICSHAVRLFGSLPFIAGKVKGSPLF